MTDLIARWRYRIAAALLGEQWYVPRSAEQKVWIVMQDPTLHAFFPVETLDLTAELEVPRLGEYPSRKGPLRRVGKFSGTLSQSA